MVKTHAAKMMVTSKITRTLRKRIKSRKMRLLCINCLLLRRFDSEAGEADELEARETGDEHARDHGKEKEER